MPLSYVTAQSLSSQSSLGGSLRGQSAPRRLASHATRVLGNGVDGAAGRRTVCGGHTLPHEAAQDVQKRVIDGLPRVIVWRRNRQRDVRLKLFRAGFIAHNGDGLKPT